MASCKIPSHHQQHCSEGTCEAAIVFGVGKRSCISLVTASPLVSAHICDLLSGRRVTLPCRCRRSFIRGRSFHLPAARPSAPIWLQLCKVGGGGGVTTLVLASFSGSSSLNAAMPFNWGTKEAILRFDPLGRSIRAKASQRERQRKKSAPKSFYHCVCYDKNSLTLQNREQYQHEWERPV